MTTYQQRPLREDPTTQAADARRRGLWLDHRRSLHADQHADGCGLCEMQLAALDEQMAELEAILDEAGATSNPSNTHPNHKQYPPEAPEPTVKRVDIFGNVIDTFQTEAELNGCQETQGRLI